MEFYHALVDKKSGEQLCSKLVVEFTLNFIYDSTFYTDELKQEIEATFAPLTTIDSAQL